MSLSKPIPSAPGGEWVQATLASPPPAASTRARPEAWWVFADDRGLAGRAGPHLAAAGVRVEMVVPGARFDRTRSRAWSVRPGHRTDLASLLAAAGRPAGVLHLWSLREKAAGAARLDAFETRQDLAIRSTLALLRTLGENAVETVRVLIGASGLFGARPGDEADPALAALPGLCAAAAEDHPALACRTADLPPPPETDPDAWASALAGALAAEALGGEESAVALRSAADGAIERWVRRRVPLPEPSDAPEPPPGAQPRPNLRTPYAAPEGELERALAAAWQRVLDLDAVGRHDSFFELGGDSRLALRLMADLRAGLGVALPITALLESPTVAGLAPLAARAEGEPAVAAPADLPGPPELPPAESPAALAQPRFRRWSTRLDAPSWKRLRERGARAGLTPSGLLLAAFSEVLATWSASSRFTLAASHLESLLPVAVDTSLSGGFAARARAVQERLWQALEHPADAGSRTTPVLFTGALGDPAGDRAGEVWIDHRAGEHEKELIVHWDAVEELFPAGMIDALFGAGRDLLRRLADDDAAWTDERRRLIPTAQLARRVLFNATGTPISHERLQGLFAARAAQHPDRPAVLAPSRTLTYGELSRLSSRLGRRLRELGARPNTLVAVVQETGWEQAVAVLGVLASGAAWLPLEPDLPGERLHRLLEQAGATIAVTTPALDASLDWPEGLHRVAIGPDGAGLPADDGPLDPVQRNTDLAYVIEGAMIDHRSALNTLLDVSRTWGVGPDDRVLALAPLSSDLAVWDLFGLLAAGGALVLPRAEARRDPAHWLERLQQERATIWNTGPALLQDLVSLWETAPRGAFDSPLRLALLSRGSLPPGLPDRLRALAPRAQVVHLHGAPEASLWSLCNGRPLANQTLHVLDDRMEPRPDWVPGHLYIGGLGLAKGYWRDAEATEARFVTHPDTGERLFRTGRRARFQPGGRLEIQEAARATLI